MTSDSSREYWSAYTVKMGYKLKPSNLQKNILKVYKFSEKITNPPI
jgi:hypothetical protein